MGGKRLWTLAIVATVAFAPSCTCRGTPGGGVNLAPADGSASATTSDTLGTPPTAPRALVRYDQLGYVSGEKPWVVVIAAERGMPGMRLYDDVASRFIADLPKADDRGRVALGDLGPGRYQLVLDDDARFGPFVVDDEVYAGVLPSVVRFLRAQRCGDTNPLSSRHGPCHLHRSITDGDKKTYSGDAIPVDDGWTGRTVGTSTEGAVDVEGGWHDAGDYVKFVGTTSFTLVCDLMALRDRGAVLASARAGKVRDELRAEMRVGLDWLAKMLGGPELFHQVSGQADHDVPVRSPEDDTKKPVGFWLHRPVFRIGAGKGRNLLGRSAAAFALAAQVFADDLPYAARMLELAQRTYAEASRKDRARPQLSSPPDWYREESAEDDLALAAATLARATPSDTSLRAHAVDLALGLSVGTESVLGWGDVEALALLEAAQLLPEGNGDRKRLSATLIALARPIAATNSTPRGPAQAFRYALASFGNGSIAESLGAAAVCMAARRLGGPSVCTDVARNQLHWLFGQNPFGVSFMVGVGEHFPRDIHHALAQSKHLTLEGAVVGGPTNLKVLREDRTLGGPSKKGNPFARFSTNELFYEDVSSNYVVNEPALDFTAPLVFVLGELLAE
jgi:endoglucanase